MLLSAWQQLLLEPSTTLPAAGCLRGQLLSMVSCLIEDVLAGKTAAAAAGGGDGGDVGVAALTAVLRLLQLNPNIVRCALLKV